MCTSPLIELVVGEKRKSIFVFIRDDSKETFPWQKAGSSYLTKF